MAIRLIHHGNETAPQQHDRIILNRKLRHAFFVRDQDPMMYRDEHGRVQHGKITFDPSSGTDAEHAARFLEEAGCPEELGLYRVPISDPDICGFDIILGGRRSA